MKKAATLLLLIVFTGSSFACSTFLLSKNGRHIFGRNYDWISGNGMMMINARGVAKKSFGQDDNKALSWIAAYGSISFNQFGKEFPHGGMNEKGLVVELMWLNETVYPEADKRAALNELQWIQYQLDNCASIDEVIATDKKLRIDRADAAPLHYLVADASGHAATIEFINGKTIVHQGKDLTYPVLTNTRYDEAVKEVKGAKKPAAFDNSVERFATACNMIGQYQSANNNQDPIDYGFNILNKIAQPGYTKWSIVYDITNLQVYCITDQQRQRKQVSLREIDLSCTGTMPALQLASPQKGNVSKLFTPLSFEQNKALITRSARESSSHIKVEQASIDKAAAYFKEVNCR
jgi:penicillin V acylase-like amidase (Ntn superfamily)